MGLSAHARFDFSDRGNDYFLAWTELALTSFSSLENKWTAAPDMGIMSDGINRAGADAAALCLRKFTS